MDAPPMLEIARRQPAPAAGLLAAVLAAASLAGAAFAGAAEGKKKARSDPQAAKDLAAAVGLLKAVKIDEAAVRLRALVERYPSDPAAEKAKALLIENGIGEEVRVELKDQKVFRDRFKLPEKVVLERAEETLKDLRERFQGPKRFFKKSELRIHFYDSHARYRAEGGMITASGHFSAKKVEPRRSFLEGKIEWYFPQAIGTIKDRDTAMKSRLCHETVHYLNAIHFATLLPALLEEGLATHFESRMVTDHYQAYRQSNRERLEGDARQSLSTIQKYPDFLKFLESARGMGQAGEEMVSRWYGLCYALVDFFLEGEIEGRKATLAKLLELLEVITHEEASKGMESKRDLVPLATRKVLERLVLEFYGVELGVFHQELVKHILSKYKQR